MCEVDIPRLYTNILASSVLMKTQEGSNDLKVKAFKESVDLCLR